MKVFKMNDCDCVCAETKEEAIDWYTDEIGERYDPKDVKEIDIEKETMWYGFDPHYSDLEAFIGYCIKNRIKDTFEMRVGWRDFDINVKMTFVMALSFDDRHDQVTPYIISSSEY
jgi:hypothetical protein